MLDENTVTIKENDTYQTLLRQVKQLYPEVDVKLGYYGYRNDCYKSNYRLSHNSYDSFRDHLRDGHVTYLVAN